MSKMAANEKYNGHQLRKCIDYFCHLAIVPEAYGDLARDSEFAGTKYFQAMEWLKHEKEDLYDPSYTDMLRVAFTSEFRRGRLEDLVALLSGRNFETREFEEIIAEASFRRLEAAILRFMNETDFRRFIMILRSAGFVRASMIRSQNTVNFAYILYLTLRARRENPAHIETLVRRWFVMSVLTGRYTGSPETAFGVDIRNIADRNAQDYLDAVEQAELSDAFWNAGLPQQMDTSVASSPYFNVFLASQVKANDKGFISSDHTVQTLLEGASHVHHVFPRNYLKNHGLPRSPSVCSAPISGPRTRRPSRISRPCARSSRGVNQSAAASLDEGFEETLTLHRLGVFPLVGQSLKTTNVLESVNALAEQRCGRVDHWKHSSQKHRWLATTLLEIESRLRRLLGYRHLPLLRAAIQKDLGITLPESRSHAVA